MKTPYIKRHFKVPKGLGWGGGTEKWGGEMKIAGSLEKGGGVNIFVYSCAPREGSLVERDLFFLADLLRLGAPFRLIFFQVLYPMQGVFISY